MKKIVLSFVTLFIMSQAPQAQLVSILEQGAVNTDPIRIMGIDNYKNASSDYSFYLLYTYKGCFIYMVDHSRYPLGPAYGGGNYTQSQYLTLGDYMVATDIYTIDHYAIICGMEITNNGPEGFIGYFDVNNLINFPYSATINRITISGTTCVNKVTANMVGGTLIVEAIGTQTGDWYNNLETSDCIIEWHDALSGAYTVRFAPFYPEERIHDIHCNSRYFYVVGYDTKNVGILIRRFDNTVGVADITIYDRIVLPCNTLSVTRSTCMDGDNVGITYLDYNALGSFTNTTRVVSVSTGINSNSQEFIPSIKSSPDDIKFIPSDKSLVVMQRFDFGPGLTYNSNFIYLNPSIMQPYNAEVDYIKGTTFSRMDLIDQRGRDYFAVETSNLLMIHNKTTPWPWNNIDCPIRDYIGINTIDNVIPQFLPYPLSPNLISPPNQPMTLLPTSNIPTLDCFSN